MNFIIYGKAMKHKRGEFCLRKSFNYYFISRFLTDYLIEINSQLVKGRAGDFAIFEPWKIVYHGPLATSDEGFVNDWLYIDGEDFRALTKKYPLPLNVPFRVNGEVDLGDVIDRIDAEKGSARIGSDDICNGIMTSAIIELYRLYTKDCEMQKADGIKRAHSEIRSNYKRRWTLRGMAEVAGYSPSRFSALYSERYSASPIDDLIKRRLEQAKLLMLYGNMTVTEIAEEVGFASIYYFSKCFKAHEGMSPSEFIRLGAESLD